MKPFHLPCEKNIILYGSTSSSTHAETHVVPQNQQSGIWNKTQVPPYILKHFNQNKKKKLDMLEFSEHYIFTI